MKETFKTAQQFAFVLIALLLSVVLAQGFSLDFSRITEISYWVLVVCDMIIMLFAYNTYWEMDNRNRRLDDKGRYYALAVKYRINIDRFYSGDYYDKLVSAVELKNAQYREQAFNKYLHAKASSRLSMRDFGGMTDITEVEEVCRKKLLSADKIIKVKKCMKKIFDGDIQAFQISVDDILIDRVGDKWNKNGLAFNNVGFFAKENVKKAICFIGFSMLSAVIFWQFMGTNILETILSKFTLLFGAISSAIFASRKYIKLRSSNLDERNRILENLVFEDFKTKENITQ